MLAPQKPGLTDDQRAAVLAHYRAASPLIEANFAGTPFIYTTYPGGFDADPEWHGAIFHAPPFHAPPRGSHTIPVPGKHGVHRYLSLSAQTLLELVEQEGAVEFLGWGAVPGDPLHARFARILLEVDAEPRVPAQPHTGRYLPVLAAAAQLMRGLLQEHGIDAIALLPGGSGIALWIPLADAPLYPDLRVQLHALCEAAADRWPAQFTTQPNTHKVGRVHLHVESNAPGRCSALPYSLRGEADLPVCTPVSWDELHALRSDPFVASNFAQRVADCGDRFASLVKEMKSAPALQMVAGHAKAIEPHGYILRAAAEILQDGVARDAAAILREAVARGLAPAQTSAKYVYTSLLEYIVRTSGHGHRPLFVQNADRTFRINEPPDPWPAQSSPAAPALSAHVQALIARLQRSATGDDPAAFELAVCDAFAQLGFSATHVGGQQAPDGYADAQLGPLGYRTMLECKTGAQVVAQPDAVEASKYRDAYGAQYCALVGPAFSEELELASELQTHRVSAWTADDLVQLLSIESNPWEMRALFAPGFVSDSIADVMWDRLHGAAKRVELICAYLQAAGWDAQVAAAMQGAPADAPHLTLDAAMLLVDERLRTLGSTAACSRAEVQLAFEYLTNPRSGVAVWVDDARSAIAIVRPADTP